ncbi:MAG: aldehyde dehydrogenase family protein [Leptospirales bacterium]
MEQTLHKLGLKENNSGVYCSGWLKNPSGPNIASVNPANGKIIAHVKSAGPKDLDLVIENSFDSFKKWSKIPAPHRGEIIRQIAVELRKYKTVLARLLTMEMGKTLSEAEGEVQEMIDVADFAVGLSRQLYGLTMHSERAEHRMYEQWHPLGPIGIISAFNFPAAVWSWNAMIGGVCGDTMVWKPSSKTPLTAMAIQNIISPVLAQNNVEGIMNLVIGSGEIIGEGLIADKRIALISATGSVAMGRKVAGIVARRFGKTILELGGNNAIVVMEDANMDLVIRAILFAAIGTAGQRCTTTRRILAHKNIHKELVNRLVKAYASIKIGDPLDKNMLMGPLVDKIAVENMQQALVEIVKQGGEIIYGGNQLKTGKFEHGFYMEPTIVLAPKEMPILQEEVFAPILYIIKTANLKEAIEIHNNVPQGLSSALFTESLQYSEQFLSHCGSDCGIANINIGTSGAEIGGAFGGEKDTGGGRESGSDAWKVYMRRQTTTINWSGKLPLSQGIKFGNEKV